MTSLNGLKKGASMKTMGSLSSKRRVQKYTVENSAATIDRSPPTILSQGRTRPGRAHGGYPRNHSLGTPTMHRRERTRFLKLSRKKTKFNTPLFKEHRAHFEVCMLTLETFLEKRNFQRLSKARDLRHCRHTSCLGVNQTPAPSERLLIHDKRAQLVGTVRIEARSLARVYIYIVCI